ncbi:hypothetical protein OGAPHI_001455 [Ogataea philodendri]|uniref:Uncharacterized protein n=1 Tax=Ogataea philodendri TaxID=1378263 RepID=A0A9P8T8B0_9ASCO|nr:uncharacterized protein OGAPHI_001455 [Ogataea philodendri]KAH3669334.1 hypothetical protein OGAPHI_001455 [Ogataea philodendri]
MSRSLKNLTITWLGESSLQDLQHSNGTWDTNELGHGRVSAWNTVVNKSGGSGLGLAVSPFNTELVLQNHQVSLVLGVLHQLLKSGTQGVERVSSRGDVFGREHTEPLETSQDSLSVGLVLELGQGVDLGNNILLRRGSSANVLGNNLVPWSRLGENLRWVLLQESHVDKNFDEFWETLESQSTSDDGLGLWNAVQFLVHSGVSVWIADQGVSWVNEVWLGRGHKVLGSDLLNLTVLPVSGLVSQSKQDTSRRPRELVSQWIVGILRSRQTTTVRQERGDLTAGLVDLVDGLDGIQVVNTWVQTDLVHDNNTGFLDRWLQLLQSWRDVRGGHDIGMLGLDGSLDNASVVDVWDQRDHNIVLVDLFVQSFLVGNVQRQCAGHRAGQFLSLGQGSACNSDLNVRLFSKNVNSWLGNEARSEK